MGNYVVSSEALLDYCTKLMMTQHVPEDEAKLIADHLVEAEMCGVSSHGVSRTSIYLKRLASGVVNAKWDHKVEREFPAAVQWNACNSMGMVTGVRAMERWCDDHFAVPGHPWR